jgi:hypothetical protein
MQRSKPELVDYVTLIEEAVGLEREAEFRKLTSEQLRDAEWRLRTVADCLAEELYVRRDPAHLQNRQPLPATELDPISAVPFARPAPRPGGGTAGNV